MTKHVYRVKKDRRLTKNSDLTVDKEKPIVEEISVSFVDPFVPNIDHTSKNIAEQKSSSAGWQDDLKVTGSDGTGLTGVQTGLISFDRNSHRDQCVTLRSKGTKKKPSFAELLHKYQKIAEQNKNNRLGVDQSGNSSSPKARHQWSSHLSSLFIPSMHMPWNTHSGITNPSPWCCYNPWLPYYDYQHSTYALPRSSDLYNRPPWPCQNFSY